MDDTILAGPPAEPIRDPGATPWPAPLAGSTALVVLGMHRSGTSALAGMLHHLGVALGPDLRPPSPDNPRGDWEHAGVVDIDQRLMVGLGWAWDDLRPLPEGCETAAPARRAAGELSALLARDFAGAPLWGVKDPRLCRLLPLWRPLLAGLGARPCFILAVRHPAEVAGSLLRRDGLNAGCAAILWLRHVLEAERGSRGAARAIVHYEDLVGGAGWRAVAARLAAQFGIAWPRTGAAAEAAVDSYLAPELRHHRAPPEMPLPRWVAAVYAALAGDDPRLPEICDVVRGELDAAGDLFLPVLADALRARNELAQRAARLELEVSEMRGLAVRAVGEIGALKQGTAAITREGKPLAAMPGVEEAYPQWIASRLHTATARADWIAERLREWPALPRLALGMIVPAGAGAGGADAALAAGAGRRALGAARRRRRGDAGGVCRPSRPLLAPARGRAGRGAEPPSRRQRRRHRRADRRRRPARAACPVRRRRRAVPPPRMGRALFRRRPHRSAGQALGAAFQARFQPRPDAQPALCRRAACGAARGLRRARRVRSALGRHRGIRPGLAPRRAARPRRVRPCRL